ncbi:MAG: HPr family phosphocarrier protein [Candidatus Omnitrophica bacterium]|nr:HPr family phosphocarrier protein [Candidatus Omnitrophota bacterium]
MEKIEKEVIVNNIHGLHARPAALFVQLANRYDSTVKIEKDREVVDAKSIIAILSLGVNKGTKIRLIIEGPDANQAWEELKRFLEKENV